MELYKIVEIEGRKFRIKKFDAVTAVKISKLLAAKVLPALSSVTDILFKQSQIPNMESIQDFLDLDSISRALDLVADNDLHKIINASLKVCEEELAAGYISVKNDNGSFAIVDLEYDPVIMLRLVVEAIAWGLSAFFDGNRLTSILTPISTLFQPNV